jgi:hypothetical protein
MSTFEFLKSCPQSILKKSRKGLLLLLLLPELILLLLRLPEAGEAVAEAGHWPSLLLRSEVEKIIFMFIRHRRKQ